MEYVPDKCRSCLMNRKKRGKNTSLYERLAREEEMAEMRLDEEM